MRGTSFLRSAILFGALALGGVGPLADAALAVNWNNYTLGQFYDISTATDPAVRNAGDAVVFFGNATGFVVSPEGHVLTNYHVYQSFGNSGTVYVEWTGTTYRRTLSLQLVAASAGHDVALYKANVSTSLPYLKIDSRAARVGEDVFVLGHPNSRSQEVSFGKVLATGLNISGRPSIEYSAQTWWGSSGSPVCDRAGNTIAIHWGWDANGRSNGRLTGVPFNLIVRAVPQIAAVASRYGVGASGTTAGTGTGTGSSTNTGSGANPGTGTTTNPGTGTGSSTPAPTGGSYAGLPSLSGATTLARPGSLGGRFNPVTGRVSTPGGSSTTTPTPGGGTTGPSGPAGTGSSAGTTTPTTGGATGGSTRSTIPVLAIGGSAIGNLARTGDVNYFRVDLPARGDLTVSVVGPANGADFDLALVKWDFTTSSGTRAGLADGATASETITVRDASAGTYIAVVNSYAGSGPYTISSRVAQTTTVGGSGTGTATGTIGTATDILQGAGDWRLYTLTALAGAIRVSVDGPTGADFDVYVFRGSRVDSTAVVAVGDSVAADESVSFHAQAGTYTILVRSADGAGRFNLSVQR